MLAGAGRLRDEASRASRPPPPGDPVSVVVPVHGNAATLAGLAGEVGRVLAGRPWELVLVIDASPDDSLSVARRLAETDGRVRHIELRRNLGQHLALAAGLAATSPARWWVCLDADLQDPPEAIPALLDRLAAGDVAVVFAGRRGGYESRLRLLSGGLHRRLMSWLTGLPPDAGAFLAMDDRARQAVVGSRAPSIVAAIGVSGLAVASLPVVRRSRPQGRSAWTWRRRLGLSANTLVWVVGRRRRSRGLDQPGGLTPGVDRRRAPSAGRSRRPSDRGR